MTTPVWTWLPGAGAPTLAGTFLHDVAQGVGRFRYDVEYLRRPDALPLDPISMPIARREIVETRSGGIFGVLRDSGPDSWGQSVLRHKHGRELTALEMLELAPGDGAGAIAVGDIERKLAWRPWTLADLKTATADWIAARAVDPESTAAGLAEWLELGTSMGGAKPKATVLMDGELWLAKLVERGDNPYSPIFEHVALQLARECGIDSCDSEPYPLDHGQFALLVRRFDRATGLDGTYLRHGFASAATALRLGDRGLAEPGRTYPALAQEIRRWCARQNHDVAPTVKELWCRIVFNCLVGNGDDHPRNHGLLRSGAHWNLSPAFDIMPAPRGEQPWGLAMPFLLDGATRSAAVVYDNLVLAARDFGVPRTEAVPAIAEMTTKVLDLWEGRMIAAGVPAAERARIAPAFTTVAARFHAAARAEIVAGILPEARRGRGAKGGRLS